MILLAFALAVAAECKTADAIALLPAGGEREDYYCLADAEEGKQLLLAALADENLEGRERLQRALALWLLERTDRPMDPAVVAQLSPADRRLLADGIRARRGRPSPAPAHAQVFEQFAWYTPVANYTDAKLRPIDRENLLVVDPPVRVEPPPEAAAPAPPTVVAPAPPVTADTPNLCGCAHRAAPPAGVVVALLTLLGIRRRAR